MNSAVDLFSTYAGRKPDLEPWLRDATLNRDRNLRLQYLAGLGLNLYQADVIYADLLKHVTKLPDDLFVASDATKATLFAAIALATGRTDALLQVLSALTVSSSAAVDNPAAGIQVLGGMGYTFENDMHLYLKRAHVFRHLVGEPADVLAELLAQDRAQ